VPRQAQPCAGGGRLMHGGWNGSHEG
jgi:hypothetical protein